MHTWIYDNVTIFTVTRYFLVFCFLTLVYKFNKTQHNAELGQTAIQRKKRKKFQYNNYDTYAAKLWVYVHCQRQGESVQMLIIIVSTHLKQLYAIYVNCGWNQWQIVIHLFL